MYVLDVGITQALQIKRQPRFGGCCGVFELRDVEGIRLG
jgi:hypothetical protein